MKTYISLFIIIVVAVIFYLLSPWGPTAATMLTRPDKDCKKTACMPPLYVQGEEALRQGRTEEAIGLSLQGKREASDSDEYYRFVVLDAKRYFCQMKADSMLYCQQRLSRYLSRQQSLNHQQKMLQVEAEMQIGVYMTKMAGQMDSALLHNQRALQLASAIGCGRSNRLILLANIADTYKQLGRYDKCIDYFNQALELADSMGGASIDTRITITQGIASAYSAMHSFEESRKWWEQAEQMMPQMKRDELFNYLNNRGNDYFLQAQYEESLKYFLRLDSLTGSNSDMLWEHMFGHCNLSGVLIKLGKTQQAKPILEEAEQFFTRQRQPVPLYYLTTQRIEMAVMEGKTDEAARIDRDNPTPQWMIPEQRMLRQEALMELYKRTNRWQLMAQTVFDYVNLKDSLAGENMKMRSSELLLRYNHEKQLEQKQRQIEQKELSFHWTLAMLVTAVALILLLTFILVQKHKEMKLKNSIMESRIQGLRMETVRNRITPHFIGNALSAEIMAQAEGRQVDLDAIVELLHRGMEMTGTEQSTLKEELEFIDFYCNIAGRSVGPDFHFEMQLSPDIDCRQVKLPSMSVQILVENAIKHGLKRRKPSKGLQRSVIVKAAHQQEATLIEVIDNGVGLPTDRQNSERTGLKVLRETFNLLNQQNTQQVSFGLNNYYNDNGEVAGCRAFLLLPDNYSYKLLKE